ncbi:MAG: TonB C-terminal domain-containing protein [Fibromonadales bacterium]|nr:TonB C-terminal domain-containing protein [Fibromonadales bacterium]
MYSNFYSEKNEYLSIIAVSLLFHFTVVAALLIAVWLRPAKENPTPIPFFEMVNVAPPPPAPSKPEPKPPEPISETIPEPVVEPEPVVKPDLKPELKPEPKPPTPVAKPEPKPKQESKPTPVEPAQSHSMDMPDLPSDIKNKDMDMPALTLLSDVTMDPQMQAYINTLVQLLYRNFNPPAGTEISKGTKSTVQFQIARNGEINEVVLRSSSGSGIWDRLAVRAVQITKLPPIPPSFTAENLICKFDFKEK